MQLHQHVSLCMSCRLHGQVEVAGGKLRILKEGRNSKFKAAVAQKTFAASSAAGRPVLYVTERAVFRLREGAGLQLTEVCLFWPPLGYFLHSRMHACNRWDLLAPVHACTSACVISAAAPVRHGMPGMSPLPDLLPPCPGSPRAIMHVLQQLMRKHPAHAVS
jgi:hypothetical protein